MESEDPYCVTSHTFREATTVVLQLGFRLKRRSAVIQSPFSFSTMPFRAIENTGQANQRFLSYLVELLSDNPTEMVG